MRLWDAATGQPLGAPLTGHTGAVDSVAFSPDGTRIASGSDDQTVRLWDAATGQPVGDPLTGHTGAVDSVAFSPDGTRIASGSDDQTVRLWPAPAPRRPVRQAHHQHEPPAVERLGVARHRLHHGLPGPAPREVAIGGGPPNSERRGQLAHRLTGGGEPAQLLLTVGG